jgi:hypothetical protein
MHTLCESETLRWGHPDFSRRIRFCPRYCRQVDELKAELAAGPTTKVAPPSTGLTMPPLAWDACKGEAQLQGGVWCGVGEGGVQSGKAKTCWHLLKFKPHARVIRADFIKGWPSVDMLNTPQLKTALTRSFNKVGFSVQSKYPCIPNAHIQAQQQGRQAVVFLSISVWISTPYRQWSGVKVGLVASLTMVMLATGHTCSATR